MARRRTGPRPKPHNVTFPLTAWGVEGINQNFDALFKDVRTVGDLSALLDPLKSADVAAGAPTRGALIVGTAIGGGINWAVFPLGLANRVLRSNGAMPEWAQVILTSDVTGVLPVENGGTERATFAEHAVVAGGATATGPLQQVSGLGTNGQVLTSQGAGALPTWQDASGGGETHNDGYWSPLTNGDPDSPELIFADGDAIMGWVPTP